MTPSIEQRVFDTLDTDEGTDRWTIRLVTGLTYRQVSGALGRLHRKGLIHGGRWRETFVWFRSR